LLRLSNSYTILVGDERSNKTDLGFRPDFRCLFITDALRHCYYLSSAQSYTKFTIYVLEGLYINANIEVFTSNLPTNFSVELIGLNDVRILCLSTTFMIVLSGNWSLTNIKVYQFGQEMEHNFVVHVRNTVGTFNNILINGPCHLAFQLKDAKVEISDGIIFGNGIGFDQEGGELTVSNSILKLFLTTAKSRIEVLRLTWTPNVAFQIVKWNRGVFYPIKVKEFLKAVVLWMSRYQFS